MRLAFNGEAHYVDYSDGYGLYSKRNEDCVDRKTYARIIRIYCKRFADRLLGNGFADLPCGLGMISAAMMTRRPQYRGKKFVGYGKMDWESGHYDGNIKAFGVVYLPRHGKNANLRSYGFVANRQLFKRMKEKYISGECDWEPIEFNDEMI